MKQIGNILGLLVTKFGLCACSAGKQSDPSGGSMEHRKEAWELSLEGVQGRESGLECAGMWGCRKVIKIAKIWVFWA